MSYTDKEATEHQKIVHSQTTGLDNNTCPQCKSEGGQYLDIENKGESWTQTYCCYCKEYLNLDDYYNPNINEEDTLYLQLREKREPLKILQEVVVRPMKEKIEYDKWKIKNNIK